MHYDQDSFLAGVAVGRQLKGWAMGGKGGDRVILLSDITVQPQATTFIETPAEGFDGIGSVTVLGDTNLLPQNIRSGVRIFGVDGTYSQNYRSQEVGPRTVVSNGTIILTPSSGYNGISKATIVVAVPTEINNQSKTVTPGYSTRTVTPDSGYSGLSQVIVSGSNQLVAENIRNGITIFGVTGSYGEEGLPGQSKSVTPRSYTQYVRPDTGYVLNLVTVNGDSDLVSANIRKGIQIFGVDGSFEGEPQEVVLQNKTVTLVRPTGNMNVYPDSGYNALSRVTINGDANLQPGNIKNGVTIFGQTGTYESPLTDLTVIPSTDRQYITTGDEYLGFRSVTVEPASAIEPVEWDGTQAEYDALEYHDPKITYYISRGTGS